MPPVVVLDAGIAIKRLPRPTPLNASAPPEFLEDDIRYVISEPATQLANTCHDPNTGEFCGTGRGSASAGASSVIDKLPKPGPVKDLVDHALSQIDAVHGLPAGVQHIPEVYTLRSNAANLGQYTSTAVLGGTERSMKIGISSPDKVDPEYAYGSGSLAFAHEFGHYLDSVGGLAGSAEKPNPLRATLAHVRTPEWEAVYKAVLDSPARKALKTASTFGSNKAYNAYLASPVESFARAYSQWIATRSGDSKMLAEVAMAKAHPNESVKNSQWSEEEFAPIAKAFDNLFASKGLLKSPVTASANPLELFSSLMEFANSYHDEKGRFTEVGASSAATATSSLPPLTPEQYKLLQPGPVFHRMLKADTESQIMQTPNGHAFVQAIDDWADAGKTKALRANITKEINNPGSGNDKARAVLGALRGAAIDNQPLYRGMTLTQSHNTLANKYKEGSTIDMNLSSFSTNHEVANGFAVPEPAGSQYKSSRVMLVLTGPHKAVPIQNLTSAAGTYKELEHVTGGRFKVFNVSQQQLGGEGPEGKFTVIQLHQVNTL